MYYSSIDSIGMFNDTADCTLIQYYNNTSVCNKKITMEYTHTLYIHTLSTVLLITGNKR